MSWNFTASYRGFACKGGPALSQILQCSKYIISGRRGFCSTRNTLFLAVAGFAALEIHYFWLSQNLQRPKYTISGRRGFCSARNTLFRAVADFAALEIHYFWPSQILQRSKYTISGCRRFCSDRNTLFLAAADFKGAEIHYFWPSQICNNPSLCLTAPPHRITLSWPPFPLSVGISYPTWDRRLGGWRTAVRDRCR